MLWTLLLAVIAGCTHRPAYPSVLTVLVLSEPSRLDPRFPEDALGAALGRLVWRPLFDTDPRTLLPRPVLADGLVWRDDTHLRVHIRPGVSFQDGSPLAAADVVATYRSLLDPALGSRVRGTYARVLGAVTALDPSTVEFTLLRPDGTFESLLQQPILRARDAIGPELVTSPGNERAFIGSGELRVVSLDRGRWEFDRVHPVAGAPGRFRFLSLHDPNTLALRLLHGDADVAEIKPELYPVFDGRPGFEVASARAVGVTFVGVHCDDPRLADRRVRAALAYAIDRDALRRGKFGSRALPADGPLPPQHWAYAPDLPRHPFDPARARTLLDAAGLVDPPGRAPRARFVLRVSSQRFSVTVARALAAMLADVGVELDVRPSELPTLLADLRAGRFDLALATIPDLTDPWGLAFWFATRSIPAPGNPDAGGNRWRFRDATLDAALEAGARARGPDARRPYYQTAQRILAEQLPVIPLWHADVVFAGTRRYRGLAPRGDGTLDFLLDLRRR